MSDLKSCSSWAILTLFTLTIRKMTICRKLSRACFVGHPVFCDKVRGRWEFGRGPNYIILEWPIINISARTTTRVLTYGKVLWFLFFNDYPCPSKSGFGNHFYSDVWPEDIIIVPIKFRNAESVKKKIESQELLDDVILNLDMGNWW